jgi:hypothetical protein
MFWITLALLAFSGCSTLQGTIASDRYTSKDNSFEVKIPYPKDIHIKDGYSQCGEFVQFDLEYAYSYRIERYKKGKQAAAQINETQNKEIQLQQFKTHYLTEFKRLGVTTDKVLHEKIITLDGQEVVLIVLQISMRGEQRIRGLMFFITDSFCNTIHYSHPAFRENDTERILNDIQQFYTSLKILNR